MALLMKAPDILYYIYSSFLYLSVLFFYYLTYILIPYNIFKFITKNQSYVFCFPHVSFSSNSNLL